MRNVEQQVRWFAQLDAFEREADRRAVEVRFVSPEDERAYEACDWSLHSRIQAVFVDTGVTGTPASVVHVIEDWWPNKTKYLEVARHALNAQKLAALQATLAGEHGEWCINIQVYEDLSDATTWLGTVNLYADEIIGTAAASRVLTAD
jgi:hypothetical protein